jgi:dolichol kinase
MDKGYVHTRERERERERERVTGYYFYSCFQIIALTFHKKYNSISTFLGTCNKTKE